MLFDYLVHEISQFMTVHEQLEFMNKGTVYERNKFMNFSWKCHLFFKNVHEQFINT